MARDTTARSSIRGAAAPISSNECCDTCPPAFREDPLRVLRVARFAARFAQLGFAVARRDARADGARSSTSGEIDALQPGARLAGNREGARRGSPGRFLHGAARLRRARATCSPRSTRYSACRNPSAGIRRSIRACTCCMALRVAARLTPRRPLRFAVLTHDLGKAARRSPLLPHHHGHERAPWSCSPRFARAYPCRIAFAISPMHVARHHGTVHRAAELKPQTVLEPDHGSRRICVNRSVSRNFCSPAKPTRADARSRTPAVSAGRPAAHGFASLRGVDANRPRTERNSTAKLSARRIAGEPRLDAVQSRTARRANAGRLRESSPHSRSRKSRPGSAPPTAPLLEQQHLEALAHLARQHAAS